MPIEMIVSTSFPPYHIFCGRLFALTSVGSLLPCLERNGANLCFLLTKRDFRVIIKKKGRKRMKKYRCTVCGEVFEVADGETPVCPLCGVDGDALELIEE